MTSGFYPLFDEIKDCRLGNGIARK